jgi:formylglycine-generating enzyme required for sulfatase activity
MSGNILEWCWDSYQYGYSVKDKSQRNPTGPEFSRRHIVRGGTWGGMAKGCTVTKTDGFYSNHRSNAIGFRIARSF